MQNIAEVWSSPVDAWRQRQSTIINNATFDSIFGRVKEKNVFKCDDIFADDKLFKIKIDMMNHLRLIRQSILLPIAHWNLFLMISWFKHEWVMSNFVIILSLLTKVLSMIIQSVYQIISDIESYLTDQCFRSSVRNNSSIDNRKMIASQFSAFISIHIMITNVADARMSMHELLIRQSPNISSVTIDSHYEVEVLA